MVDSASDYRFELKYLVSPNQLAAFEQRIGSVLIKDVHDEDGTGYHVSSVYYDSPHLMHYHEKLEGDLDREKPRLRIYRTRVDGAPSACFFEFKVGFNHVVRKERVALSVALARQLLNPWGLEEHETVQGSPVLRRFLYLVRRHNLQPRMSVVYHRRAFSCSLDPDMRITYDTRIQCSPSISLGAVPSALHYVLAPTWMLIEVKVRRSVPRWFVRQIQALQLQELNLSKYVLSIQQCFGQSGRWWGRTAMLGPT